VSGDLEPETGPEPERDSHPVRVVRAPSGAAPAAALRLDVDELVDRRRT
jgi:hypothetical protein